MGKNQNQHLDDSNLRPLNQNNPMSDDPAHGNRPSFTTGTEGSSPAEKKPEQDRQDQETVEAFGERGAATTDEEA